MIIKSITELDFSPNSETFFYHIPPYGQVMMPQLLTIVSLNAPRNDVLLSSSCHRTLSCRNSLFLFARSSIPFNSPGSILLYHLVYFCTTFYVVAPESVGLQCLSCLPLLFCCRIICNLVAPVAILLHVPLSCCTVLYLVMPTVLYHIAPQSMFLEL